MGTSLTLFRAFDIEVRVHWSFVLILAYFAFIFSASSAGPLVGSFYGILVALLLFLCVTLHEFGHALVAQYYDVNVSSITLLPIGGVANLERMPNQPIQEFFITVAGPLVNFVIAAVLLPVALFVLGMEMNAGGAAASLPGTLSRTMENMLTPGVSNLLILLIVTNISLGVFNLLPAFPMDGGRILRALLAMTMSYVRATRIAVTVGRLMAVLFAIFGLFGPNIILLLIAFFVYVGGGAEQEAVESRTVLKNVKARQALTPNATSLYSSERVSRATDLIMNSYQTDYPVLDLSGKFLGVLTRARLIRALKEQGPDARIVDVMLPAEEIPVCSPSTDLSEVWELMVQKGMRVVAIRERDEFLGLITIDDITEVIQVMGATLEGGNPPPSAGGVGVQRVGERAVDV